MKPVGFEVKAEDREVLESWLRSKAIPQALGMRARVVLLSGEGTSLRAITQRFRLTERTVCLWRRRFQQEGVSGLRSRRRRGRPRGVTRAKEFAMVTPTSRLPPSATHWSARRLVAKEMGVSFMTVHRISGKYGLQPHRVETFKFSTDPEFDSKLADTVRLYLDPPERAPVLCLDEKSQIQALDRTQPLLPLRPGIPAQMTHDYDRHGTTSLFAALEVASGEVDGRCFRRHRHQEFIAFLKSLAKRYPRLELHLICDNYGTHKHPKVKAWLEDHPRFHQHFTPISASWLEPGRTLVRHYQPAGDSARQFHQRCPTGACHHSLPRPLEPERQALRLDQDRPSNQRHQKCPTISVT
jgi:transposase